MMCTLKIRKVSIKDLDQVARIERKCFLPKEAASEQIIKERIIAFPGSFLVAEKNNKIVGFINGRLTNSPVIYDQLYHDICAPEGENSAIFGLAVDPEHQKTGIASKLMRLYIGSAKNHGLRRVILTCKEPLIYFYEHFGFVNGGISKSTHGDAQWFDMTLFL